MGERAGHAFRGNQWVGGIHAGGAADRGVKVSAGDYLKSLERGKAVDSAVREHMHRFGGGTGIHPHIEAVRRGREAMERLQEAAKLEQAAREDANPDVEAIPEHRRTELQILANEDISSSKHLGGGINPTYKVEFADGTKAVFKPAEQRYCRDGIEDKGMEREVVAWDIAAMVGMHDMVQPTIEREVKLPGGREPVEGSLQAFVENAEVARDLYGNQKYGKSLQDVERAAAYDYVLGNLDRHAGNWMVTEDGKMQLIDHGLALSSVENRIGDVNAELLEHVAHEEIRPNIWKGETFKSPREYAKPYVEKRDKIVARLRKKGFDEESIALVNKRIDNLKDFDSWEDIVNIGRI